MSNPEVPKVPEKAEAAEEKVNVPENVPESVPEEETKPEEAAKAADDVEDEESLVIDEDSGTPAVIKSDPVPPEKPTVEKKGTLEDEEDEEEEEKEFEPSIDMMINDFDDERTLEEEEAMMEENSDEAAAEAEALEQEADMPLEDLLKMYGYANEQKAAAVDDADKKEYKKELDDKHLDANVGANGPSLGDRSDDPKAPDGKSSPKPGEKRGLDEQPGELTAVNKEGMTSGSPQPPAKKSKSELARFYEATVEGRSLRSSGLNPDDEEDEEEDVGTLGVPGDDEDEEGRDYSWKKTIMIGPSYQASVPNGLESYEGHTLPYENEDKLLWNPTLLNGGEIEDYLFRSQESLQNAGVTSLPLGGHIRDDEQALFLLHQCGNNFSEALRRRRMNSVQTAETMSLWSEEECRSFELGLRLYGKDFHMIQQQKVRTRSVGELVQFYYLWKKTERHDVFANATRMEKKKYTLHPGTTDYMDRFIDEQDPARDLTSPPNYHSLLYGAESKRNNQSMTLAPSLQNNSNLNSSNESKSDDHHNNSQSNNNRFTNSEENSAVQTNGTPTSLASASSSAAAVVVANPNFNSTTTTTSQDDQP